MLRCGSFQHLLVDPTKAIVGLRPRFGPTYPDFLHGAPPTSACAAFIKERRMKFANAGNSTGNPEYALANVGHPSRSPRILLRPILFSGLTVCVRSKETADLSTPLRSGPTARRGRRDDKFIAGRLLYCQSEERPFVAQQICHLACPGVPWDRSVRGFPATQDWTRQRVHLSLRKGA
jgi:hypothetical protein